MSISQHTAIPGFTLIAPTIWEREPTGGVQHLSTDEPPSLIVILPWTGAHGRHVAKYAESYQTIFPLAPILCITTSAKDICFRSSKRKQRRLQPAITRILHHIEHDSTTANVLIHAFSEGGSNKAVELAAAYHAATDTKLPCAALYLDSTPGHPRYLRLCNALRKSLPPIPILNCAGLFVGSALLGGIWVFSKCINGAGNDVISRTRRRLQDPTLWDTSAPRCYLYSKGDRLIAWTDVREHLGEAVRAGAPVMDVCFEDSAHCKHAVQHPDRYWGAVVLTWKRTRSNKDKRDSMLDLRSGYGKTLVVTEKNMSVVGVQELLV